ADEAAEHHQLPDEPPPPNEPPPPDQLLPLDDDDDQLDVDDEIQPPPPEVQPPPPPLRARKMRMTTAAMRMKAMSPAPESLPLACAGSAPSGCFSPPVAESMAATPAVSAPKTSFCRSLGAISSRMMRAHSTSVSCPSRP